MPLRMAPKSHAVSGFGQSDGDLRDLATRLEQAVMTLRCLPRDATTGPAGARSAWPDMIRRSRFVIEGTRRMSKASPTPEAVDDLDRIARLMWQLSPRNRQLLWARACGVRWAELCQRQRRSRTTLYRDHRLALVALARAEAEESP